MNLPDSILRQAAGIVSYYRKQAPEGFDPVAKNTSESTAQQTTTDQQMAVEGGGASSGSGSNNSPTTNLKVSGLGAGSGSSGLVVGAQGSLGHDNVVSISTSDPNVTETALTTSQANFQDAAQFGAIALDDNLTTSGLALAANTQVTHDALAVNQAVASGAESLVAQVAQSSIQAGDDNVAQSDAYGMAALQAANNATAGSTTAVEALAGQYAAGLSQDTANAQIAADNALTGGNQPIGNGQIPTNSATLGGGANNLALWIGIIAGGLGIIYYLKKGSL